MIKKAYPWILLISLALILLVGCAGKDKEVKTVEGDPETLYKKGLAKFNKRDYAEALKIFEELKATFPDNPPHTLWAELKIGDCHFFRKEYVEAVAAYEEFKKIHPTYEEIPYVQFQIGMAYYNQILSPDRDQTPTKKALSSFEYLIANTPPNLFTEKAKERVRVCRERLADHEFYIGDYYYGHGRFEAASARFQALIQNFPKMRGEDRTLYLLGKSYLEMNQGEKARGVLDRLLNGYPESSYAKESRAILDRGVEQVSSPKTTPKAVKKKVVEPEDEGIYLMKFEEEPRRSLSLDEAMKEEKLAYRPRQSDHSRILPPPPAQMKPEEEKRKEVSPPPLPFEMKPKAEIKTAEEKRIAALPPSAPSGGEVRKEAPPPAGEVRKEAAPPSLSENSSEKGLPIDITSDKVEAYFKENLILFKGNVIARQKDMVIYADSLEAVVIGDGKGIEKVTAGGNVRIQQGLRLANCQKAVFYNLDRKVILTGDPKVMEGEDTVSGEEIVFDIEKDRIEVKGGKTGRGKVKIFREGDLEKVK
jgi:outer membrane protein assembly factor BamD